MGVSYVTPADIANALDSNETARLAQDAYAGTNQLICNRPVDVPTGALLLVGYRGQTSEMVTVGSSSSSDKTVINLAQPLTQTHPAGTLLLDVTPFPDVAEAASRLVDQLTNTPAGGWAYADQITEIDDCKVSRDGVITLCVGHAPVKNVYEVRYQTDPWSLQWSTPIPQVWWDDESYIVRVWLSNLTPILRFSRVRVQITYEGGYKPDEMPQDIKRATAILAARLWKEKDSGYSDVIGSHDFGIIQYTKAAPKDVLAMLQPRKRVWWT